MNDVAQAPPWNNDNWTQLTGAQKEHAFLIYGVNGPSSVVPEPTSMALFLPGIALIGALRKRGRKKAF
jgi:hypothetical protein